MSFEFSVVRGETVHRVVHADLPGCVEVVRAAYLAHHRGRTVNPPSSFLRFLDEPRNRIIALPAHLGDEEPVSGIKWIASYPGNVARGIHRASAVLVLNRAQDGYPFACLEASIVSAARTAASAVLAAEAMVGRRHVSSLGIVGTGVIARNVYEFLMGTGWQIGAVRLHDLDAAQADRFGDGVCLRNRHPEGVEVVGAEELLRASDLVVFTTVAPLPHVHDALLFAHRPVVLHLSLRDLAPAVILAAHNVVDDVNHVMTAQTSLHLAEQATGSREFVTATLAQLLMGERRLDRSRPSIFSPFGLGILDVAVGRWVYRRAEEAGELVRIDRFFHETKR